MADRFPRSRSTTTPADGQFMGANTNTYFNYNMLGSRMPSGRAIKLTSAKVLRVKGLNSGSRNSVNENYNKIKSV